MCVVLVVKLVFFVLKVYATFIRRPKVLELLSILKTQVQYTCGRTCSRSQHALGEGGVDPELLDSPSQGHIQRQTTIQTPTYTCGFQCEQLP